jgi:hypothetical protein
VAIGQMNGGSVQAGQTNAPAAAQPASAVSAAGSRP